MNRLMRVGVNGDHLELAAIMGVDEAGCVRDGKASLERHAASRLHEPRIAVWKRDGEAGRDERALVGWNIYGLVRPDVKTGIA